MVLRGYGTKQPTSFGRSFPFNRLTDLMQLDQINILSNYLIHRKQLIVNQVLAVLSNAGHKLFLDEDLVGL